MIRTRPARRTATLLALFAFVVSLLAMPSTVLGALPGAIMTTDAACAAVNLNQFASKLDVHVEGLQLTPGTYYVRVEEPGGTVLGQSLVANLTVDANGDIVGCPNVYALTTRPAGGQGYNDTTNPGGVYMVFISMDPTFPAADSKSDNFKVVASTGISLAKSAAPPTYSAVGQVITYTYTITNTGGTDLGPGQFTISDNKINGGVAFNCGPANQLLGPGASFTCTNTYTITQADLDAGSVTNTATASIGRMVSNPASATVNAVRAPGIGLTKTAAPPTYNAVGQVITYTYTITNTGNVTLGPAQFTVSDDHIGVPLGTAFNCGPAATTLAPGASVSCTNTYTITQADLNAGSVTNTATASGAGQTSLPATATVNAVQGPAIGLTKTALPITYNAVGQVITYTYTITNTGNVTLGPAQFTISDNKINGGVAFNCGPAATTLAPGASVACTNTYTITLADLNAGSVTNSATATGGGVTSPPATATVNAAQGPAIVLTKTPTPTTYTAAGQVITYSYNFTNGGNVTLFPPFTVTDDKAVVTCPQPASLAPGATIVCSAAYTITAADVAAGSVINTARGGAFDPAGVPVLSNIVQAIVVLVVGPALNPGIAINKTASPTNLPAGGGVVTYTYAVTNPGNTPLVSVVVTDNKCAPVTFTGGDTNGNAALDPGETWTYTCTATITTTTTNVAVANANSAGGPVTATDNATVTVADAVVAAPTPTATASPTGSVSPTATATTQPTPTGTVLAATSRPRPQITLPPTDTLVPTSPSSTSNEGLFLILMVLVGIAAMGPILVKANWQSRRR